MDYKHDDARHEHASDGDKNSFDSPTVPSGAVVVTDEDSRRICRKTDIHLLT